MGKNSEQYQKKLESMDKNKSEQHIVPKLNNMKKTLEEIQSVLNKKVAFYEKAFFAFILALLFVGAVLVILQNCCNININDISSRFSEWISKFIGFGKESSQNGTRRFCDTLDSAKNELNEAELSSIQEDFKEFFKADNKDTMYWYYRIFGYESSLKQSANLGNPFAQYELANKEEDQEKKKDLLDKSMTGLEKLAEQNNPYACLLLSHIYKKNKDIAKGNKYELKARIIFRERFLSARDASETYKDIFVTIPQKCKNGKEIPNDFKKAYEDYEKEDFQASLNGFLKVVDYENSDIDIMNAKNLAKKFICFLYTQGLVTKEGLEGRIKDWMNGNDKINLTINPPEFNNNILISNEWRTEIDQYYDLLCEQFGTPKDDLQILKSSNNITVEDREYLEKKAKYGNIKANLILYILYKRNGDTKNSQRYLQDTKKYIKKCNKENNSNIKKDNKDELDNKDKLKILEILCWQDMYARQIDKEHYVFWNPKLENRLNNAIGSKDLQGKANEINGVINKYMEHLSEAKENFKNAIEWYKKNNETGKYNYELGKCYYEIIEEEIKAPYQHLLDEKRKDKIKTIYYNTDSNHLKKFFSDLQTNDVLKTYIKKIYENINNQEFRKNLENCEEYLTHFVENNPKDKKKEANFVENNPKDKEKKANAKNMLADLDFYYKVQEILVVCDRSQNTPLNNEILNNEILNNIYYNIVAEKLKEYTNEAINLYTEASENNNPEAICNLKRYYRYRNETAEYNKWEEKSNKIDADNIFQAEQCKKINWEIHNLDNPFKGVHRLKNIYME